MSVFALGLFGFSLLAFLRYQNLLGKLLALELGVLSLLMALIDQAFSEQFLFFICFFILILGFFLGVLGGVFLLDSVRQKDSRDSEKYMGN